jgi:starch-binding outer membrane protein, SusD/RagB family
MKRYKILTLLIGLLISFLISCSEDFLDKAPESGIPEQEVFTKYENFLKYFRQVYEGSNNIRSAFPVQSYRQSIMGSYDSFTELNDQGYIPGSTQAIKLGKNDGTMHSAWGNYNAMWRVIRVCNTALKNISKLQDASQEDKDDLIAQAYFVRAFANWHIFRLYGGQPYITKVVGAEDPWDLPRLTPYETLIKMAADLDTAYTFYVKAERVRRDNPVAGAPGNLDHPDMRYPSGVAAKALKARVLLYAASPLNNKNGASDWQNAAAANWEAIELAQEWGYSLMPGSDYKKIFISTATNEHIWTWPQGNFNYNTMSDWFGQVLMGSTSGTGENPTQNFVDMYETRWGDPLNTSADREAATLAGHYYEQDLYNDRDPRFYLNIIYNTAPLGASGFGTAKMYYEMVGGNPVYSELLVRSKNDYPKTGYIMRKAWGEQSVKNQIILPYNDPIIRLAELYLNYAEAANEAYGPSGAAPGATMTSVQALNTIRGRVGHVDVPSAYTGNKDVFRPRIKNERTIELCYEGHYYFDTRRWKDAPMTCSTVNTGIDVEKLPDGYDPVAYPTGYRYTRVPIALDRQSAWYPFMYYWPTSLSDSYKMKTYVPNPLWN